MLHTECCDSTALPSSCWRTHIESLKPESRREVSDQPCHFPRETEVMGQYSEGIWTSYPQSSAHDTLLYPHPKTKECDIKECVLYGALFCGL